MAVPIQLATYQIGGSEIRLYEPNAAAIAENYQRNETPFPYWSQVWPAAVALAQFIAAHPVYVQGKNVLELAAGLGLPSMVAAQWAAAVTVSDYVSEAVAMMEQTVAYHHLQNATVCLLDWNHLPENLTADVLLLSDVSYDTALFAVQEKIIRRFLEQGTTVLISTPQRLVAKQAIEPLLPFCQQQEELLILHRQQKVPVTVLVLAT